MSSVHIGPFRTMYKKNRKSHHHSKIGRATVFDVQCGTQLFVAFGELPVDSLTVTNQTFTQPPAERKKQ